MRSVSALVLGVLAAASVPLGAQDRPERARARIMARDILADLRRHYYDSTFHGIDLAARFNAMQPWFDSVTTNGQLFALIADAVQALNDSHTNFIPPRRAAEVTYGWLPQMIGDSCYIVAVATGSDAARQGVHVGDRLVAAGRFVPRRDNLWNLRYLLQALDPRAAVPLTLESVTTGARREVVLQSSVRERHRVLDLTFQTFRDGGWDYWDLVREDENREALMRDEFASVGQTQVWRLPTFVVEDRRVDDAIDRARRHRSLVIDLRGNEGGYVRALERLVSRLFRDSVVLSINLGRRDSDTSVVRPRRDPFLGTVVVLIDSRSGSASEILAATVQRLNRGIVLGDRSAGVVMMSRVYPRQAGGDIAVFYRLSITVSDVLLPGGTRLEGIGVTPDPRVLPTADDLAAGRDPVLAVALQMLGHETTSEQAGRVLPGRVVAMRSW